MCWAPGRFLLTADPTALGSGATGAWSLGWNTEHLLPGSSGPVTSVSHRCLRFRFGPEPTGRGIRQGDELAVALLISEKQILPLGKREAGLEPGPRAPRRPGASHRVKQCAPAPYLQTGKAILSTSPPVYLATEPLRVDSCFSSLNAVVVLLA